MITKKKFWEKFINWVYPRKSFQNCNGSVPVSRGSTSSSKKRRRTNKRSENIKNRVSLTCHLKPSFWNSYSFIAFGSQTLSKFFDPALKTLPIEEIPRQLESSDSNVQNWWKSLSTVHSKVKVLRAKPCSQKWEMSSLSSSKSTRMSFGTSTLTQWGIFPSKSNICGRINPKCTIDWGFSPWFSCWLSCRIMWWLPSFLFPLGWFS